jgi:hypothetical protein
MTSFDIDLNTNSMCTLKVTVRLMHNETYYNHTMPMIFTVILVEYCSRYIIEINIFYAKESNILFFSVHIKPEI